MNNTVVFLDEKKLEKAYLDLAKDECAFKGLLKENAPFIIRRCAKVLKLSSISIWLLSEDETELFCLSQYNNEENKFEEIQTTLTKNKFPKYFDALNSSRVVDAQFAKTDARTKELADSYLIPLNIKSLLDASLRNNGDLTGVLCCEIKGKPRNWTNAEKTFITSVADLVSQRLLLEELQKSEAHLLALFEVSPLGIFVFGSENNGFLDGNPAISKIFRAKKEEILGKTPLDLSPEYQPCGELSYTKAMRYIEACLAGETQTFEWVHTRLDGSEFDAEITLSSLDSSRSSTLLFAVVSDISNRKKIERDLEYRASHDSLTGLLNRDSLHQYLNQRINHDQREKASSTIALLLLDLNQFKEINDTFGHIAGDEALKAISYKLNQFITKINGRLFRLGGDEFIVVVEKENYSKPFKNLPEVIKNVLNETIYVNDLDIKMSASIGASLYPENGADSHELLRCADVAMYYTKSNDSQSCWYDVENDVNSPQRLTLKSELDIAIENEQLRLYFQPKVNIQTQEVVGFEALVRWQHPKLGLLLPDEFLPLIEMTEMIHDLTDWVLKNAINSLIILRNNGFSLPIAINVSARNILNSNLSDAIQERLLESKIEPSLLEIEITETALITNMQQASKSLNKLDTFGVSIAIDDFGTGFSSLSHIANLPLDTIKIDPVFIEGMIKTKSDFVIVNLIINLAKSLSLNVVAEGVENQETFDALEKLQCNHVQGFFIAKPMELTELQSWLEKK